MDQILDLNDVLHPSAAVAVGRSIEKPRQISRRSLHTKVKRSSNGRRGLNLLSVSIGLVVMLMSLAGPTSAPVVQAGCVGDICTSGCAGGNVTLELGYGLKLPNQYDNGTGSKVTITGTMKANNLWGPEHVVFTVTLPANIGVKYSESPVVQTDYSMPVGVTDRVVVEFTSSATGATVIDTCDYQVTLTLPEDLQNLIQVPVRWCAIEGSPQAEGKKAGELASGTKLLSSLREMNDNIWVPGAHIAFRSAPAVGIPVVADPWPPTYSWQQKGDINAGGIGAGAEGRAAVTDCEQKWAQLDPSQKGVIVVNARLIVGAAAMGGFAPAADNALWVGGSRGDALCGHPRKLVVADVTPQYAVMTDFSLYGGGWISGDPVKDLAHELGHVLMLGHGDGLDNNHDGLEPPNPGPRRYDQYCDPQGNDSRDFPLEDVGTTAKSLMDYTGDWHLTPLQVEQARAAAKLMPGAIYDKAKDPAGALISEGCAPGIPPCALPPDVYITKVQVSETPDNHTREFSHTIWGPIPSGANNEYIIFADLDNNPTTGCAPSALGFPTSFQGAELVSRVAVGSAVTANVWECQNGTLVQVINPGTHAYAFGQTGEMEQTFFSVVSIHMPDTVGGTAGNQVRIQAIARQSGGQLDRLPKAYDGGGVISLVAPQLAQCTVTPPVLNPGATATVKASGLVPNGMAEVYVGDQLLAKGPINAAGSLELSVAIPSTSREGVRPLTVLVQGTVIGAEGAVLVQGLPLTPATTGTLSPSPNWAGWNKSDVTLTLLATGVPGGPAIKDITYSASGAQPIGSTKVNGASAQVIIYQEGQTTFSFFATDTAGTSEAPQSIIVRLDKTPPSISGSADPAPNSAGWNNQDVTVSFACADDRAGMAFCTGPTILASEGANLSVNGTADDFAQNSANALVNGIKIDKTAPSITFVVPLLNSALQDGVTLAAVVTDALSGVVSVRFSIRESNGPDGKPIGFEDLPASFNIGLGRWEYHPFDTTKLLDGNYLIVAKALDAADNLCTKAISFEIRNWAVIQLLPATPSSNAGRTMPVKFALRISANVNPKQPFVYNEELKIIIYDVSKPGNILQTSFYGKGSTNYRIDPDKLYITNFKTLAAPAVYVVEIWRSSKNFMIGSFTFKTVK